MVINSLPLAPSVLVLISSRTIEWRVTSRTNAMKDYHIVDMIGLRTKSLKREKLHGMKSTELAKHSQKEASKANQPCHVFDRSQCGPMRSGALIGICELQLPVYSMWIQGGRRVDPARITKLLPVYPIWIQVEEAC